MRPFAPKVFPLVLMLGLAVLVEPLHALDTARHARVGVLNDNYPYSFLQADGTPGGFSYDLVREIEQAMGLQFERVIGPTDQVAREFAQGRLDLLQSLAQFPEREKTASFSVPYLVMYGTIFVRNGDVLGKYRVTKIESEAVELLSHADGTTLRLGFGIRP